MKCLPVARNTTLLQTASILLFAVTPATATITALVPCLAVPSCVPGAIQLPPGAITAGAGDFTLRILGTELTPDEELLWNGFPLPSTHISGTEKQAVIRAGMIGTPGRATVTLSGSNSSIL